MKKRILGLVTSLAVAGSLVAPAVHAQDELVRRGEAAYKACGLGRDSSDEDILSAMAEHAKLIERPIVVKGDRAVLGRPPENVLALLD